MTNFDVAFDHLLRWEGGYVNTPDDLGGETKYGLTKRRYPDLDIAAPTIEEARAMYRRDFFDGLNLGRLPDRHQYSLFEACVSQGPHGASARYNGERACDRTASSAPSPHAPPKTCTRCPRWPTGKRATAASRAFAKTENSYRGGSIAWSRPRR